jgi:hypothetical protein
MGLITKNLLLKYLGLKEIMFLFKPLLIAIYKCFGCLEIRREWKKFKTEATLLGVYIKEFIIDSLHETFESRTYNKKNKLVKKIFFCILITQKK